MDTQSHAGCCPQTLQPATSGGPPGSAAPEALRLDPGVVVRTFVFVAPAREGWKVQMNGRTLGRHRDRDDAITVACRLAARHPPASVYSLGTDGHFRLVWDSDAQR